MRAKPILPLLFLLPLLVLLPGCQHSVQQEVQSFLSGLGKTTESTDGQTAVETGAAGQEQTAGQNGAAREADVPLEAIGKRYSAVKNSNLRSGPGTGYDVVGSLKAGQTVNVIGKVRGGNWYLVGEDGESGSYVYGGLLAPCRAEAASAGKKAEQPVSQQEAEQPVAQQEAAQPVKQETAVQKGEDLIPSPYGVLLYDDKGIKIYGREFIPDRKIKKRIMIGYKIVYAMSHEEAGKVINDRWLLDNLYPVVVAHSLMVVTPVNVKATVSYYKEGESEYREYYVYNFYNRKYVEVVKYYQGRKLQAETEVQERNWLGGCLDDGPFCDLPFGKYYNAIYRNDVKTIKELDRHSTFGGSWIILLANKYMYQYRYWKGVRMRPNAIEKTFSCTTPTYQYTNLYGMDMGTAGGFEFHATYCVNHEFGAILDEVGSHLGDSAVAFVSPQDNNLRILAKGVGRFQENYKYDSPEVRQFETNLISITEQFLEAPQAW